MSQPVEVDRDGVRAAGRASMRTTSRSSAGASRRTAVRTASSWGEPPREMSVRISSFAASGSDSAESAAETAGRIEVKTARLMTRAATPRVAASGLRRARVSLSATRGSAGYFVRRTTAPGERGRRRSLPSSSLSARPHAARKQIRLRRNTDSNRNRELGIALTVNPLLSGGHSISRNLFRWRTLRAFAQLLVRNRAPACYNCRDCGANSGAAKKRWSGRKAGGTPPFCWSKSLIRRGVHGG